MSEELIKNEQTTTLEVIEVEAPKVIEVVVDESIGWVGGDTQYHHSLAGRNDSDQHEIKAITGLREELDILESLRTLYSDSLGVANYYEWEGSAPEGYGYFVSLALHSSKIKICEGSCIFGVTVNSSGFVGGQCPETTTRPCGLVSTFGQVDVRCEPDVAEGDCVISNSRGEAAKTTSGCGYTVINVNKDIQGVHYATISLGIQACVTDAMGKKIQRLMKRMDDAVNDIASAMNVANQAYNKSSESGGVSEDALKKALEALAKSEETDGKVEDVYQDLVSVSAATEATRAVAESAYSIAEGAVSSANDIRNEAEATANEVLAEVNDLVSKFEPIDSWVDPATGQTGATYFVQYMDKNVLSTKAEIETVDKKTEDNKTAIMKNAESIQSMVSSVDKYSVGEYSQAYGLSLDQARSILKEGMVYIPTKHGDVLTHTEKYEGGVEPYDEREFIQGYYYVWTNVGDGEMFWKDYDGKVWFNSDTAPTSPEFEYWYNNVVLFKKEGDEWVEVATLAGNVNNRIVSMVRQDVDSVAIEIVNARGSGTSLSERLTNTDATIASNAFWKNDDGSQYVATLQQKADGDGSSLALIAHRIDTSDGTEEDKSVELKGASIVLGQEDDDSYITISADNIVMDGTTTFITPGDLSGEKTTEINGANITTGTITADHIATDAIKAEHIESNAIKAEHIEAGAIKTEHIEAGAIKADQIDVGAITADHIATDAIKAEMIDVKDLNAFGATIAGWSIKSDRLSKGTTNLITDDAVTGTSLIDGSQSPIRISVGASRTLKELEATVYAICVDGDFSWTGNVSEFGIQGELQSVEIITCTAVSENARGETFDNLSAEINGDVITLRGRCVEGSYEGDVDIEVKLTYTVVDVKNSNFQVLEDGSLYAKKFNAEGNSQAIYMSHTEDDFTSSVNIPYYIYLNPDGDYMFSQDLYFDEDGYALIYASNYTIRYMKALSGVKQVAFDYSILDGPTSNAWKGIGVWPKEGGIKESTFIRFAYADANSDETLTLDTSWIESEFYACVFLSHEPADEDMLQTFSFEVSEPKVSLTPDGYRGCVVPVESSSTQLRALYIDEYGRLCVQK